MPELGENCTAPPDVASDEVSFVELVTTAESDSVVESVAEDPSSLTVVVAVAADWSSLRRSAAQYEPVRPMVAMTDPRTSPARVRAAGWERFGLVMTPRWASHLAIC